MLKLGKSTIKSLTLKIAETYRRVRARLAGSDSIIASLAYIHMENARRRLFWRYTFVKLADMLTWTLNWSEQIPGDYDLIIGIPRSGLLIANVLSIKMGKPLSTPELFLRWEYWMGGDTAVSHEFRRILLVDDSVHSGKTMAAAMALLKKHAPSVVITKAAMIVSRESAGLVDYHFKIIPPPRLFEWNMLHVKQGVLVCDLDGVICENCPSGYDADEELYVPWLNSAKPYLIPTFEVDYILSARLEKYRSETEAWLSKHGVKYGKLILWNVQDKKDRNGKYSDYKIAEVLKIKPEIIWESNYGQARDIWRASKIPTLCTDTKTMFS